MEATGAPEAPLPRQRGVRGELHALLILASPLLVTNLGTMLLGIVDTAVVGRLGETALAAVGLGNALFFTVSVLGWGWMLALDPLIAQAVGAGETGRTRHLYWQGLWIALLGTIPLSLAVVGIGGLLERMGIDPQTAAQTRAYLWGRLPGLLPFLALAASRAFLQAHAITRPLVIGVVVANALNLPVTWLLVYGDAGVTGLGLPALGVPALGTAGAGVASALSTFVQLLIAVAALRAIWGKGHAGLHLPARRLIAHVLRLGTPIGLTLLAEVGSFSLVTVLMGNISDRALAAHNVTLTLVSTTFQIALALGAAGSVRVGHAIGRADAEATRRAGLVAIVSGAAVMLLGSVTFVAIPRLLARILTDEVGVIEASVPLFLVAAAFQLSDGVQAVAAGVLRGAGDTRIPLLANLAGHYAIGIPIGASLAFVAGWGAVGLWWGLSAGLTAVAILLSARFWVLSRDAILRA